jgi:hypothetical protein
MCLAGCQLHHATMKEQRYCGLFATQSLLRFYSVAEDSHENALSITSEMPIVWMRVLNTPPMLCHCLE